MTADNILSHEIIGLGVRLLESTDPRLEGLNGTVVFETRNTFSVRQNSGRIIQVAKKVAKRIEVQTRPGVCFISGSSLIGRPEDRLSRLN
ncbi:MAG: ribonuclease P protein component 1 [Nitrososphaera sp.]